MIDFEILPQRPDDPAHFESLLDRTFGPDRLSKTVYRLREGVEDLSVLRFVAVDPGGRLLASLRFWPILIEAAAPGECVPGPDLPNPGASRHPL